MKGKLLIDFDGIDNTEYIGPVITVDIANDSRDPRDKLLKQFFQDLGGDSSWVYVKFSPDTIDGVYGITSHTRMYPIKPKHIEAQIKEMQSRIGLKPEDEPSIPSRFQIDDEVDFTTMKKVESAFPEAQRKNPNDAIESLEYTPEYMTGTIVAIKFTKAKVWYDVLDDYTGKVIQDLQSDYVKKFKVEMPTEQ